MLQRVNLDQLRARVPAPDLDPQAAESVVLEELAICASIIRRGKMAPSNALWAQFVATFVPPDLMPNEFHLKRILRLPNEYLPHPQTGAWDEVERILTRQFFGITVISGEQARTRVRYSQPTYSDNDCSRALRGMLLFQHKRQERLYVRLEWLGYPPDCDARDRKAMLRDVFLGRVVIPVHEAHLALGYHGIVGVDLDHKINQVAHELGYHRAKRVVDGVPKAVFTSDWGNV